METGNLQDKKDQVLNEEDQLKPVNPQDNLYRDDTLATDLDKKKGYSEGNKNDSGTEEETTDDAQPKGNNQKTGKDATGK